MDSRGKLKNAKLRFINNTSKYLTNSLILRTLLTVTINDVYLLYVFLNLTSEPVPNPPFMSMTTLELFVALPGLTHGECEIWRN